MDPIITKTGARAVTGNVTPEIKPAARTKASKFEAVREQLQTAQTAQVPQLPPPCQVTPAARKTLEGQLRRKLDATSTRNPAELFRVDMKSATTGIERLKRQAEALPKGDAYQPLRERLQLIEQQFTRSGADIEKIGAQGNPRELLKLQLQMYQMTMNIEVVTKVVEQVNSGVKQILQTQV